MTRSRARRPAARRVVAAVSVGPGLALGFALGFALGCSGDLGIAPVADVGFVVPSTRDVGGDGGDGSGSASSECAIMALSACPDGRPCCATPAERCIPRLVGGNACVASGARGEGETCGTRGVDDCAFGLLCAGSRSEPARLVCRRLCELGTEACGAGACRIEAEVRGEAVSLCE